MNEAFLFILIGVLCVLAGAFLGNLFARLKSKTETSKLEERLSQAKHQEERLGESLGRIEKERDAIRNDKDFLNEE